MGERTDPMTDTSSRTTDELRNEIRRTQEEIRETVDSIHFRLSPEYLKYRARQQAKASARRVQGGLMGRIREHPIPAAMVGMGLMMLMRGSKKVDYEIEFAPDYELGYGELDVDESAAERLRHSAVSAKQRASRKAGQAKDRVVESAEHAKDRVSEMASTGAEKTRETMHRARMEASDLGQRAMRRSRQAQLGFWETFESNPLVIGAAGLALGALLGAAIPESDKETELFGPTHDRIADKAREMAREKTEQIKHVAEAAVGGARGAAREKAREEGLVSDESLQPVSSRPNI